MSSAVQWGQLQEPCLEGGVINEVNHVVLYAIINIMWLIQVQGNYNFLNYLFHYSKLSSVSSWFKNGGDGYKVKEEDEKTP